MDIEKVKEKVLKWRLLAEQYKEDDENVFIKKINGDLHFCKILLVDEKTIKVENYDPAQRAGTISEIDWLQIDDFDKVREESEE